MQSFIIEGGRKLSGTIQPQGAKNEALEVICASLLTTEPVHIKNIPDILDVNNLILLLESMGVSVKRPVPGSISSKPTSSTSTICRATSSCAAVPHFAAAC